MISEMEILKAIEQAIKQEPEERLEMDEAALLRVAELLEKSSIDTYKIMQERLFETLCKELGREPTKREIAKRFLLYSTASNLRLGLEAGLKLTDPEGRA